MTYVACVSVVEDATARETMAIVIDQPKSFRNFIYMAFSTCKCTSCNKPSYDYSFPLISGLHTVPIIANTQVPKRTS